MRVSQSARSCSSCSTLKAAGHDLRDVAAVAQADAALGARAGLGEADAGGAAVVRVGHALDAGPRVSSRATSREIPAWVSSASSLSSVIRRPSGAFDSA